MRVPAAARSLLLWAVGWAHFLLFAPLILVLSVFFDPARFDWLLRLCARNVVRLAGASLEVRRSPRVDPARTYLFAANHVNLFDPFVLYCAIPQRARGLELDSHFRYPVYGWLMKRMGNVGVPVLKTPSDLKRMWKQAKKALDAGTSLAVFPEGKRTRTGRVGPFKDGVFRMAARFGLPVVPISIAGAFEWNNRESWRLRPGRVVVTLHDPIEPDGQSVLGLRDRAREIIASAVEGSSAAPS